MVHCAENNMVLTEYGSCQYNDLQKTNLYIERHTVHSYFDILDSRLCFMFLMCWQCD